MNLLSTTLTTKSIYTNDTIDKTETRLHLKLDKSSADVGIFNGSADFTLLEGSSLNISEAQFGYGSLIARGGSKATVYLRKIEKGLNVEATEGSSLTITTSKEYFEVL